MKRINVDESGEFICLCGNTPRGSGFDTCLADGTVVEPVIDGPWCGHYRCMECDLVVFDEPGNDKPPRIMGNAKAAYNYLTN